MSAPRHGSSGWDEFFSEDSVPVVEASVPEVTGTEGAVAAEPRTTRMPVGEAPTVRRATATERRVQTQEPTSAPAMPTQAPAEAPTAAPTTRQRTLYRKRQPRRTDAPQTLRRAKPRPQATGAVRAVASQPYDDRAVPASQTAAHRALSTGTSPALTGSLLVAIMALRLAAIGLCGLVVALALPGLGTRLSLVEASSVVSALMPRAVSGAFVVPTPFGGAFRGDFALAALALYVADWLLTRLRAGLIWGGAHA